MMNRNQLKRRKETMFVVGAVILLFLNYLLLIHITLSPRHPNCEYTYKNYTVSSGERLWDIAEEELESNTYYEGEDIRQIVYEIQKDNNISSKIYEGQTIKIRIKKDELSNTTDQSVQR